YAAPVLESHSLRATFFITTGLVGTLGRLWFDEAAQYWNSVPQEVILGVCRDATGPAEAEAAVGSISAWMHFLKAQTPDARGNVLQALRSGVASPPDEQHRMMTWSEVAALQRRGHEIGAHTRHHPLLPQLGDLEVIEE